MTYDEIIQQEKICDSYGYGTFRASDGKIYNVKHLNKEVLNIRDPNFLKYEVGQTVLVRGVGEYGEIDEVKPDEVWGNHLYAVSIFNDKAYNTGHWHDEHELEEV